MPSRIRSRWLQRQLKDPFVTQATEEGMRSRAAYKLLQTIHKYNFIRRGQQIVDLGAAPGGWTQALVEKLSPTISSPASMNDIRLLTPDVTIQYDLCADQVPVTAQELEQRVLPFVVLDARDKQDARFTDLTEYTRDILVSADHSLPVATNMTTSRDTDEARIPSKFSAMLQQAERRLKSSTRRTSLWELAADEVDPPQEDGNNTQRHVNIDPSVTDDLSLVLPPTSVFDSKTRVIAVDILPMKPLPGAFFICGDFTQTHTQQIISKYLRSGQADAVISDMAHSFVGDARTDAQLQMNLSWIALQFALRTLKRNGSFLAKVRSGGDNDRIFAQTVSSLFEESHIIKPDASRADSAEYYVIGLNFKRSRITKNIADTVNTYIHQV